MCVSELLTYHMLWRGGVVVRTSSDLQLRRRRSPGRFASRNNFGQVVHTHVNLFTKQYKLVLAQAGS